MAKKEEKAIVKKLSYIVTEKGKGLSVGCSEGNISLGSDTSQSALKFVYENVKDGHKYVRIVSI